MDPNANLEETRTLAGYLLRRIDTAPSWGPDDTESLLHDTARLAELVQALDGWISAGGFLPQSWSGGRP